MTEGMMTAAIIVAAGRGRRVGGGMPKQWRTLKGRAMAAWTIDAFRKHPGINRIVLVLHPQDMAIGLGYAAHGDVVLATGGATRSASVRAGLEQLHGSGCARVLIHDVARPLIPAHVIDRVITALDQVPGAAPAIPVVDALWRGTDDQVDDVVDRANLWRAQTPQGFHFDAIEAAHRTHGAGTDDDVAVARAAGLDVTIVEGDERNLKITTAEDFARAETLMEGVMDVRMGNGFDVHPFAPGTSVTLCGVDLPHDRTLKGHSDADVGMHALTDAIYGALCDGDIGRHFPPSDPKWKGAASEIFLDHAASQASSRGYKISNADVTLICEAPRIGPYASVMSETLAAIMGIAPDRVSVKGTTSEKLGFTGRQEGIAAIATVTLVGQ